MPSSSPKNQTSDIKNSGLKATLPRIKILEIFQRAQQRLEARLGANSALSNGAAITKAEAQQNGLGYIARHFDEIDTSHTGRVSLSDVRQYLQQKQQHQ